MTSAPLDISLVLRDSGIDLRSREVLILGTSTLDPGDAARVHTIGDVGSYADLDRALRVDVGIVVGQLENMTHDAGVNLLSRLRDVHCGKVLPVVQSEDWTSSELLALGYQQIKSPSSDGRCYLYAAENLDQPREWNNPVNWANPENFRKYRW